VPPVPHTAIVHNWLTRPSCAQHDGASPLHVAITSDAPVAVRWLLGRGDVDPNKLGYDRWQHAPRVPPLLQALRGLRLGVLSVMHAERLACTRALLECPRVDLNARCSDGTPLVHHLVEYGHILDGLEPADDEYDLSRHGCCRCAHECNRGDFCAPVTCTLCHPWTGLHRWCDIEEGTLWADPCSCGNAASRRQLRLYRNRDRDTNSAVAQGAPAGHVEVAVRGLSTLAMGTGSTPGRLPGPAVSDVDACAILVSWGVWADAWVDGDSAHECKIPTSRDRPPPPCCAALTCTPAPALFRSCVGRY
jgi:hypothetical protein